MQLNDSSSLSENIQFAWNNISFKEFIEVPQEYKDEVQGLIYTLNADGTAWTVRGDCYAELVTNSDITRADPGGSSKYTFINNVIGPKIEIEEMPYGIPVTTIEANAFGSSKAQTGCTNITSVKIPNTVTMIGDEAFYGCTGLTGTLTIPDSVISVGVNTFHGCNNLSTLIVGSGVEYFNSGSFLGCSNLTSITFKGTTPPMNLVSGLAITSSTVRNLKSIYVQSTAVDAYKKEVRYSNWQSLIKPL